MSISAKLKDYLDRENVVYEHHVHPTAYTAQEVAAVAHVPGREMVKSVILKADDQLVMAVLSANQNVDLQMLQTEAASKTLRLASEEEFKNAFSTCDVGAMPPFGNLFGMPTYCDIALEQNSEIEFNAGSHHDTIRVSFADYKRLAKPKMLSFAWQRSRLAG